MTRLDAPRQLTIAGFARKFSDMILGCYLAIFFMTTFPAQKTQFSLLFAAMFSTLGFSSNILNGIIGDALETKDPAIKSKMLGGSALISCALLLFTFLSPFGFYTSFAAYALHVLVSAGYQSLAITMI